MSDTFNYSLLKREDGNYILRSTITSYGLNQVTDKDIVSFYKQFSSTSSFDTGLLPLDGTGVLAIRSAGHHMQITIQHAPGSYHINWGAVEGDRNARTFLLAQPYRIVVGDFVNGNLLGAKMFYSPYPITHPNQPLYHVNLPNINCRGYRGNAVGWICLYLKEDWSNFSFNEKVSKLIERCSGVETYNDANMSETDGPRFYLSNGKPSYLWDPQQWEKRTLEEGHLWTLSPDLWIPIKVKDMDNQDKHYDDGVEFTFLMALLGNYQAYYTDKEKTKLYNVVARQDLNLTNEQIATMFKTSFAIAPALPVHLPKDNPYQFSVEHRETKSAQQEIKFNTEEDESYWTCYSCDETFNEDESATHDHKGNAICTSCIDEYFVYLETPGEYYNKEHSDVFWSDSSDCYLHLDLDSCDTCSNCGFSWGEIGQVALPILVFDQPYVDGQGSHISSICPSCIEKFAHNNGFKDSLQKCDYCGENDVINSPVTFPEFPSRAYINPSIDETGKVVFSKTRKTYCKSCESAAFSKTFVCPCGLLQTSTDVMVACEPTTYEVGENKEYTVTVKQCCKSCTGNIHMGQKGDLVANYVPAVKESFEYTICSFTKQEKLLNLPNVHVQLDASKIVF